MRTSKDLPASPDERTTNLIPAGESPCVWMQAGILAWWLCDLEFHCERCPLDAALRHLRTTPATAAGATVPDRAGVTLEPDCLYDACHVWVRALDAARVRVGLDAFAAHIAGPPRGVVVARSDTRVRRGQPCAWLEVEGGTLSIRSPLAGRMAASNPRSIQQPTLLATDPYGAGWLFELEALDPEHDLAGLSSAIDFAPRLAHDEELWCRQVRRTVQRPGDGALGPTLQDGGEPAPDFDTLLGPRRRWALAAAFLGPRRRRT